MATLRNGMIVGPLVKVERLPLPASVIAGYVLQLPENRMGYRANLGCFIGVNGFPETHPFQWYGINLKQITCCADMDILELKEMES